MPRHVKPAFPTTSVDCGRPRRSDGLLCHQTAAECRRNGDALAYDPLQGGWVRADCVDDLADAAHVPSRMTKSRPSPYTFRAWRESDAETLAEALSHDEIWRYMPEGFSGPINVATARCLVDLANTSDHHFVQAVEFDGHVIGQVRLVFSGEDEAEVSYWFKPEFWGKGHGRAIVERFTEKGFKRFPQFRRIFARVHKNNIASARVLSRCGFVSKTHQQDGVWHVFERVRDRLGRTKRAMSNAKSKIAGADGARRVRFGA